MRQDSRFKRVSKSARCPVCSRGDWCLVAGPDGDPTAVICARVESQKRCGEAGWLHRIRDDEAWSPTRRRKVHFAPIVHAADFGRLADRCVDALEPRARQSLADELGLSAASLVRMNAGWSLEHRAFTFPMQVASGRVTGIRLRLANSRKLSVRGGHEGLFIPSGLTGDCPLLIAEGPTDTAALIDLGFDAIGRPSCSGGTRHVVDFVRVRRINDVVVIADDDEPGRIGADRLATVLTAYSKQVRVIAPPAGVKDARHWRCNGATHEAVSLAIDDAPPRSLPMQIRRRGWAHV